MSEKEKYETLLFAMAEKLKEKDTTINLLTFQLERVKKQLETAEFHLNPCGKESPVNLEIR